MSTAYYAVFHLAQVRHQSKKTDGKSFGISSRCRRVYTTFRYWIEPDWQMDVESLQESSLFVFGFGDAAKADLATAHSGQNDVGAVYARQHTQRLAW